MGKNNRGSDARWRLAPALVFLGILGAWANHFNNGFHWEDFPRIVNNGALSSLDSIPRYFTDPRTSSELSEQSEYRPLLTATYAIDRRLSDGGTAAFHADTFAWFVALMVSLYALFRAVPGGTRFSALFGTALFTLHPAAGDAVNYISQRGSVIAAFGITAGLAIWIFWPRMLPERLWQDARRDPDNWQDERVRKRVALNNERYRKFVRMPLGLYLFPVVIALLADPAAAVFPLLLATYIAVFERGDGYRRLLPSGILCAAYCVLVFLVTWRVPAGASFRAGAWMPAQYVFHFFYPRNLSPDLNLGLHTMPGITVIAAIAAAAYATSKRVAWSGVSFGLWWFLVALLPIAIAPAWKLETNAGMFLPSIGLALACTRTAWILFAPAAKTPAMAGVAAMAAILLLALEGWGTFERNKIWLSEDTLWQSAIQANPQDARALTYAADAAIADGDTDRAAFYLKEVAPLTANNAAIETDLAIAWDRLGKDAEARKHFDIAVGADPKYARARSALSVWLLQHSRSAEAFNMATSALKLDPGDTEAQHTLMDIYSQRFDWAQLKSVAQQILSVHPEDAAGRRSLVLAQASLDQMANLESAARERQSADSYLKLSVMYFKSWRYEDSIAAARSALKINPSLGEAWSNISAAEHELGKDDEAIAALREVERLRPDLTFARGNIEYLMAHKAKAAK